MTAPPDFDTVYAELRRLAAAQMAREPDGHTLDATALVHEAFLKLGGEAFTSRAAFVRAAAGAMRRILIDHARAKHADKRGGDRQRAAVDPDQIADGHTNTDVLAVDEALTKFAAVDPLSAELVTLRHYAGLTLPEAADALGISPRTADRLWAFAKAWLFRELSGTFLG